MMYVGFPELSMSARAAVLPALDLADCCVLPAADGDLALDSAHVEMLADQPVLRTASVFGQTRVVRLLDGASLGSLTADEAKQVAAALDDSAHRAGEPEYRGPVERDQWTVTGQYDAHRPLHHFSLGDRAGTEWYVSSTTGELVLATTRSERFWNWLGSVPHWLYPTLLRQNGPLWIQTVIWTAVVGAFLTVVGLYIGIARLRRRRSGRLSPYRGIALWHHYLGLAFGVLTLTWVTSGLLSVNPWGLLEGSGARYEYENLRGGELLLSDIEEWLDGLTARPLPTGLTRLEIAPFAGALQVLGFGRDGSVTRLDRRTLAPAPLDRATLSRAAKQIAPEHSVARADLLTSGDEFYFEHHAERPFPVYRVILDDEDRTRYYVDAATGRLLQKVDSARRWYRWLFEGLHRFDFTAAMRQRPLWDALMILLLAGVTGVCATGTYMGIRFLLR
jgi:hypothetical protein